MLLYLLSWLVFLSQNSQLQQNSNNTNNLNYINLNSTSIHPLHSIIYIYIYNVNKRISFTKLKPPHPCSCNQSNMRLIPS